MFCFFLLLYIYCAGVATGSSFLLYKPEYDFEMQQPLVGIIIGLLWPFALFVVVYDRMQQEVKEIHGEDKDE